MTHSATRIRVAAAVALLGLLALVGTTAGSDSARQPDKFVILSTTDVKGKTAPCG